MSFEAGERMTEECYRLLAKVWKSRGFTQEALSEVIVPESKSLIRNSRYRKDPKNSWKISEALGLSSTTLMTVALLGEEVKYDQILEAFGPQDEPEQPEAIGEFQQLLERIENSPACREGEVHVETWEALDGLELERFKNPRAVEAECRRLVSEALTRGSELGRNEAVVAIGTAGVWSTIRRHSNDLGSATRSLALAIQSAQVHLKTNRLLARLLQRASYLLGDADEYEQAELLAYHAFRYFLRLGDQEGQGRALIDAGFAAYGARNLKEAACTVLCGANLLGTYPLSHIYKASAFQLAAKSCSIRGELGNACLHLEQATLFAVGNQARWASIRSCAGDIQLQLGKFTEAESAFREALQVMLKQDRVLDIVMLLLNLATIFAAQGRRELIAPLAEHLEPYLDRLPGKSQVKSHVEEACSCLRRAHLHVEVLDRFKEVFKAAWPSKDGHALSVCPGVSRQGP